MSDLLEAAKKALPWLFFTPDSGAVACRGGEAWIAYGAHGAFYQMEARDAAFYTRTNASYPLEKFSTACDAVANLRTKVTARRDALNAALGEGWVPVGERLPDDSVAVLMWSPSQGMYLGSFDAGFWFADNGPMPEEMEVTHWRELPAPPEVKP